LLSGRRDADDANVLFFALFHIVPVLYFGNFSAPERYFSCETGNSITFFSFGPPAASASPFFGFLPCLCGTITARASRRLALRWFGRRRRVGCCLRLGRCLWFFPGRDGWRLLGRLGCPRRIAFDDTVAKQLGPSGVECLGACPRLGLGFWRRCLSGRRLRFCFAFGFWFILRRFCLAFGRGGGLFFSASMVIADRFGGFG